MRKKLVVAAIAVVILGTAGAASAATPSDTPAPRALPDDKSISVPHIVQGPSVSIPVGNGTYPGTAAAVAACPSGEVLTGGGANVAAGNSHSERYELHSSQPISGQRWWAFGANTDTVNPGTIQAYAICAKVIKVHVLP
ncbi:hypothetical protein [Streptomyces sp. NPDC056323]|uniref:hypothetical protein n=1 Tax=Streptomyces sp. NPDC056323 TaxID=3345784 RepID=UPI0035E18B54